MRSLARSSDREFAGRSPAHTYGVTLALSAVTVLLVGCGGTSPAGAQPSSAQQSGSQQPSPQTSTLGATGSQTSPGSSRCHTSQLGVSAPTATGAAGTIELSFRLQNMSRQRCTIYGFVGMQMLDAAGRNIRTRVVRNGGFLSGQPGPNLVNLPPRDTATFQVQYGDVPVGSETCVQASRLLVTPPDETASKSVAARLGPVCRAGELDVSAVRPRCHTSQLGLRYLNGDGAAGTERITIGMTNNSSTSCVLTGFPGLQLLDAAGRSTPTHTVRNGGAFPGVGDPTLFLVTPGQEALFGVAYSHIGQSAADCSAAAQLRVIPPDETDSGVLRLPFPDQACSGGRLDETPVLPPGATLS
jgi:hypothetical protein